MNHFILYFKVIHIVSFICNRAENKSSLPLGFHAIIENPTLKKVSMKSNCLYDRCHH